MSFLRRADKQKDGLPDLLVEAEAAAADAALRARVAEIASREPPAAPPEAAGAVIWEDVPEVYRPPREDASTVLKGLGMAQPPDIPPGSLSVFIRRRTLDGVISHLKGDTSVEQGGLLVGKPFFDAALSAYVILIEDSLPARGGIETPTEFSYTSESWQHLTPRLQTMDPTWTIVGSYHSHPGMGVFLSGTDLDTQAMVFAQDWQVAVVIDPVADEIGCFVGSKGRVCERWFVVDAT